MDGSGCIDRLVNFLDTSSSRCRISRPLLVSALTLLCLPSPHFSPLLNRYPFLLQLWTDILQFSLLAPPEFVSSLCSAHSSSLLIFLQLLDFCIHTLLSEPVLESSFGCPCRVIYGWHGSGAVLPIS